MTITNAQGHKVSPGTLAREIVDDALSRARNSRSLTEYYEFHQINMIPSERTRVETCIENLLGRIYKHQMKGGVG